MVLASVLTVSRIDVEIQLVECEIYSWHDDVAKVGKKITALGKSLDSPHLPDRERARIHGLLGDLAIESGKKSEAADHYTEELFCLLRMSNPEEYEKIKENPANVQAVIQPPKPPKRLAAPLPFDASELTRHLLPEIPREKNAEEIRLGLPAISHGDELREIAVDGPFGFSRNAARASMLLEANQEAIVAYSSLGDRFRQYRRPENGDFMRLDLASGLFIVGLLEAWHSQDLPGVAENHRRALQMNALAASDDSLASVLSYVGNRGLLHQHVSSLISEGFGGQRTAADLLSNLHDYPLNLTCLHPVAAREYLSRKAHIIGELDSILPPREGLAKVENFRENWIRYFEEDLYQQMSRLHEDLTVSKKLEKSPVARHDFLFADAVRSVRPALYQPFIHSGISEDEANLIRAHAVCRLSANTMSRVAVPDGKRIHAALLKLEKNETTLRKNLETQIAASQPPPSISEP